MGIFLDFSRRCRMHFVISSVERQQSALPLTNKRHKLFLPGTIVTVLTIFVVTMDDVVVGILVRNTCHVMYIIV